MAITNGYTTLTQVKNYYDITGADTTDDAVLEDLVEKASRAIDKHTGRTFYARTDTRSYDIPDGRELKLDDDLLTITTLTNGDDTTIAATEYILIPANSTPYFAIKLKASSTTSWQSGTLGDVEQVIDVAGTWGWAATAPEDIELACLILVRDADSKRTAVDDDGGGLITQFGVKILPGAFPKRVRDLLEPYVRNV